MEAIVELIFWLAVIVSLTVLLILSLAKWTRKRMDVMNDDIDDDDGYVG